MPNTIPSSTLDKFTTFGDLLRYLRRRAGITQLEFSIAVGYSDSQISRLEQNMRLPDPPMIEARFVPALYLEEEPQAVIRLMELASAVRREDAPALGMCPYKGLDYFDEADAELFVGREALTEKLAKCVLTLVSSAEAIQYRFFAIVGASGSGKSSLVRAGLVPALRWNKISANWPIHVLTPSAHPLESLATTLSRDNGSLTTTIEFIDALAHEPRSLSVYINREVKTAGSTYLLLIIDQFEELFALCRSEDERSAYINNLITAASADAGKAIVVITLRADFYAHCACYRELRQALATHQEYIGAMSDEEMRRAIEEPARRGRWEFEPGLVELILHDVGHEPGALPLLSHALFETWQRRHARTLTFSGYTSAGGVRGAIAETAEAVFTDKFTHEQQAIARRIFLRLTELGDETATGDTRRKATLDELIRKPEETDATQVVLLALADARLVTTSEDSVQVAHEALIREWPTLRGWLEDNREGLRLQRHLTEAAQEWLAGGREPDLLFRGARLAQVREWAASHSDDMNTLEKEFLEASTASIEKEAAEREAARLRELEAAHKLAETERQRAEEGIISARRLRRRSILGTAGITLAVLLAIFAIFAWGRSTSQAADTQSLRLANSARQANQSGRVDLGLALALEAVDQHDPPVAALTALREVALSPGTRAVLQGQDKAVRSLAISHDNRLALTGSCAELEAQGDCMQGELILWDLQALKELRRWLAHPSWVTAVAFSLDGQILASGAEDGSLILWNINGEEMHSLAGHTGAITALTVTPTGSLLTGSADGKLILWGMQTGENLQSYTETGSPVTSISVASGSLGVVSAHQDGSIWLWSLFNPQPIQQFKDQGAGIESIAISSDGSWILLIDNVPPDLSLRKIDSLTGNLLNQRLFSCAPGHLAVSPDATDALLSCQSTIYQVDLQDLNVERSYSESTASINAITVSQDGSLAMSASSDGTMRLWNLYNQLTPKSKYLTVDILKAIAISPDGKYYMLNDSWLNGIEQPGLWDFSHTTSLWTYPGFEGVVSPGAVAISRDSKDVAAAGLLTGRYPSAPHRPAVMVWNLDPPYFRCRFHDFSAPGRALAFSPDGRYLLAGTQDPVTRSGQLFLLDLNTCQSARQFETQEDVTSIAFNADGTRAITGTGFYGRVILWNVMTGKELKRFSYADEGPVLSVAFGPDDRSILATGKEDLYLWDESTGEIINRYSGLSMLPYSMALSPDGKYVLAGAMDGTVILWDFASTEELHRIDTRGEVYGVLFSPDGKTAYAAIREGQLFVWNIAEKSLPELREWINTNRYVRELTPDEKLQYHVVP